MSKVTVSTTSAQYDVWVGRDLLPSCGKMIRDVVGGARVLLCSDMNVYPLYGEKVMASLKASGYAVTPFIIPAGEASKCHKNLLALYSTLCDAGLDRKDIVLTLGGGVVGDLCGYGAATYLRGIPFVQMPTTLLSQADSSIGGKVAVDLPQGKNLVGAFYQPRLVLCDVDTLKTLPDDIFYDGLAEVIKHGCIRDAQLFSKLAKLPTRDGLQNEMEDIVCTNLRIKADVVSRDERDEGERMLLNFGHTFGHGIEGASGYQISHGRAVAIGMAMMARAGEAMRITHAGTAGQVENLLKMHSLDTQTPLDRAELLSFMMHDKKGAGRDITLVVLEKIGSSRLHKVPRAELALWLEGGMV